MSKISQITSSEFFNGVLKSGGTAIIDLWAAWCRPCDLIPPMLKSLTTKYKGLFACYAIDAGEPRNADILIKYGVLHIPTLLLVRNGKVVDKIVGVVRESILEGKILKVFSDNEEHIGV